MMFSFCDNIYVIVDTTVIYLMNGHYLFIFKSLKNNTEYINNNKLILRKI